MDFVLLITGLIGLWLGTELTIGGALAIARRLRLSDFFVGLVILSIGLIAVFLLRLAIRAQRQPPAMGATALLGLVPPLVIKAIMGLRVTEEEEYQGVDVSECGMEAYPEFISAK